MEDVPPKKTLRRENVRLKQSREFVFLLRFNYFHVKWRSIHGDRWWPERAEISCAELCYLGGARQERNHKGKIMYLPRTDDHNHCCNDLYLTMRRSSTPFDQSINNKFSQTNLKSTSILHGAKHLSNRNLQGSSIWKVELSSWLLK